MNIRPYKPDDAEALSTLYRRSSVEQLGPRHYDAAQVAAWAALAPSPARLDALSRDCRITLVAADDDDRPLAFGDLEPDGHIHFFYCAPEAARSGVAAALYAALETRAREAGMTRLHSEASEGARRFFEKQGFAVLHRRDFQVAARPSTTTPSRSVPREVNGGLDAFFAMIRGDFGDCQPFASAYKDLKQRHRAMQGTLPDRG